MATVPFNREWYNVPVNFEVGKVVRKSGKKKVVRKAYANSGGKGECI